MASTVTTTNVPAKNLGSHNTDNLIHLLTSCVDHLKLIDGEPGTNGPVLSSIYLRTMAALQDHTMLQLSQLQSQIQQLQSQHQKYQASCQQQQTELQNWETKVAQQKAEFSAMRTKNDSSSTPPPKKSLSALSTPTTSRPEQLNLPSSSGATHPIRSPQTHATTPQPLDRPHSNINTQNKKKNSHLTPLERQKRAAMEERQLQVLEQRRKAAEEQKRLKEQEHAKFLEYEQRKEELKLQAQKEAEESKLKARKQQQEQQDTASSSKTTHPPFPYTNPQQPLSPSLSQYATPMTTPSQPTPPPPPSISSTATRPSSSSSIGSGDGRDGGPNNRGTMEIPNLPHQVPQMNSSSSSSSTCPSPSIPGQPPIPQHTPTGTDAKYSRMMNQQTPLSSPRSPRASIPPSTTSGTVDSPSQEDITSLKHNILLHWALWPPNYQVLKPISHLVCQIHTVFPPVFGVTAHPYFEGFKPIVWQELIVTTTGGSANSTPPAWDAAKLKKAVRTIRFFLHPDKLPHDLNGLQQFLCKLLWDVINDSFEDYQQQQQQASQW